MGNWLVGSNNFPLCDTFVTLPGRGHVGTLTNTFSPTLVNDLTVGLNRNNVLAIPKDTAAISRARMGNIPEVLPRTTNKGDPAGYDAGCHLRHLIPSSPVNLGKNDNPYQNINRNLSDIDNVSKVSGKHMLKFGVMGEYIWKGDPIPTRRDLLWYVEFRRQLQQPVRHRT